MVEDKRQNKRSITQPQQKNRRDDISESTYRRLAMISCNICANPNCHCRLVKDDDSNIGEAAHICAASPNGPRYNENQSPEERKSIDNFIMLCANCHKMIDDPLTWKEYPVELLLHWKELHAQKCSDMLLKEFSMLSVKDLDIAAKEIIQHQDVDTPFGNNSFNLIELKSKMDKHSFSKESVVIITGAVGNIRTVDNYIKDCVSEKGSDFPNQIRSGILAVYHGLINEGFKNDDLFQQTLSVLLLGIKSLSLRSAIIALCVYYMEHCDLFSEKE